METKKLIKKLRNAIEVLRIPLPILCGEISSIIDEIEREVEKNGKSWKL